MEFCLELVPSNFTIIVILGKKKKNHLNDWKTAFLDLFVRLGPM